MNELEQPVESTTVAPEAQAQTLSVAPEEPAKADTTALSLTFTAHDLDNDRHGRVSVHEIKGQEDLSENCLALMREAFTNGADMDSMAFMLDGRKAAVDLCLTVQFRAKTSRKTITGDALTVTDVDNLLYRLVQDLSDKRHSPSFSLFDPEAPTTELAVQP